jgi:hypothetical protein
LIPDKSSPPLPRELVRVIENTPAQIKKSLFGFAGG